jgi:hypothetical protein
MKSAIKLLFGPTLLVLAGLLSGCATLTEDAMTPIAISLSDGSAGKVTLTNKRGAWETKLPSTVSVRKSDDGLRYEAIANDGRRAVGVIPSEMGAKIVASAVFLDFGIVDAITDKHRKYPPSYVIPLEAIVESKQDKASTPAPVSTATRLEELEKLLKAGGDLERRVFNQAKRNFG